MNRRILQAGLTPQYLSIEIQSRRSHMSKMDKEAIRTNYRSRACQGIFLMHHSTLILSRTKNLSLPNETSISRIDALHDKRDDCLLLLLRVDRRRQIHPSASHNWRRPTLAWKWDLPDDVGLGIPLNRHVCSARASLTCWPAELRPILG